jgi:hypothetical protein
MAMHLSISDITGVALAFRKSFMMADLSQAPGFLPHFPDGCCSWASLFVGHYLKCELGLSPKRFLGASHPNGGQHEWIILDGIIVDITADQFEDMSGPVIVRAESEWHNKLTGGRLTDISSMSACDSLCQKAPFCSKLKPSEAYEIVVANVRRDFGPHKK